MKVRITHLKAPWPEGAKPDDVVELQADAIPAWALGKCVRVGDDVEVTVSPLPVIELEDKKAALLAEAESLGVKVDGRWSEAKLAEAIEKAKAAK